MTSGGLNYGRFMERAMRGVIAEILGQVAEEGLTGDHHFFITFDTTHPGVDIPGYLRARYPREMMIVIQHWFDDLAVMGDRFRVTLNFSEQPETLVVPFESLKTFIDPSAKFGLKFDGEEVEDTAPDIPKLAPPQDADLAQQEDTAETEETPSAEVVSIDTFRKT
ncbi:MAG: ClpXP protease specificity-enhancing factor SspB [Pseudomonadota bacterium]